METFREDFLKETASILKTLQEKLRSTTAFESYSTELAHQLHTLKGSAMTFDLPIPGRFIHEIESLLQAQREHRIIHPEWVKEVLEASFTALSALFQQALEEKELIFPQELSTKISYLIEPEKSDVEVSLPGNFPADLRTQLSSSELRNLQSSLLNENNLFLIEVSFLPETFTDKFKRIRQRLEESCEIIGTFMVTTVASENIAFRVLLATQIPQDELLIVTISAQGKIIYEYLNEKTEVNDDENDLNSLNNIVAKAISNGKQTARKLGKEIDFEVSLLDIELSEQQLEAVSIAFLHLIRNAVDHGIESKEERLEAQKLPNGHISIEASSGKHIFRAIVKDDGRGIDTKKVFEIAVQKQIVEPTTNLSNEEIWEFIYHPNFSTSQSVSEISGRGIGLDAVKSAIRQVNGEIRVQSIAGRGTEFEIYLPIS
jgi:two-component system, chemotaxis family, sensor kinase CheA